MDFEIRKNELDSKYKNHEPLIFHYVDDGEEDIELGFNDVNYEKAYYQQRSLLELEESYYNKQPIRSFYGDVVNFGDKNYDAVYNRRKKELLNLKADLMNQKKQTKPYVGQHFKTKNTEEKVQKTITGKLLKDIMSQDSKKVETTDSSIITYIGNRHFRPNDLNSEYAVFKKDGYLHVVGNFTSNWLSDNYSQIVGNMVKDKAIKNIKLWNRLEIGDTPLDGFDVKVRVNNDGNIKIMGDVDDIKYYNQFLGNDLGERKEGKHFKTVDNKSFSSEVQDKNRTYALSTVSKTEDDEKSLVVTSNIPLNNRAEKKDSVKGRKITRKVAKPSLIKRGIEKFKGLDKWTKVAIVAGVIVIVGVGVFVLGPQIINGINQLISPENVDVANQVTQTASTVQDTVSQAAQSIDYSSIGEGHTVFSNAADAANNVNGVISNQWFSNNPIDVFNTATNSYMGLTPDQLNDPNLLAELAKDPNNTMLFGNSMSDPSGFIGLDDVVNTVTKMR